MQAPQRNIIDNDMKGQRFANIDISLARDKSWKEKVSHNDHSGYVTSFFVHASWYICSFSIGH